MDVGRFQRICGMLGSEHDGERSAAALKATAMLKEAGMTWQAVAPAGASYRADPGALAGYWEMMYQGERERSTRLATDIQKLKREVDRLKSMWPNGEPPKRRPAKAKVVREAEQETMFDYDKMLREKIAEALAAHSAGELRLRPASRFLFQKAVNQTSWSDHQRGVIENALKWVYAAKS